MADAHKNFAYSTLSTPPTGTGGTSLVVRAGEGTLFPTVPFNVTVWPAGVQPTAANAEIMRVTAISTDTFTVTRAQESTTARTFGIGAQIAATITAKTLTDVETGTFDSLTVDTTTLVVDAVNNRVGVGTATPTSTLQVVGTLTVGTSGAFSSTANGIELNSAQFYAGGGLRVANTSNSGFGVAATPTAYISIGASDAARACVNLPHGTAPSSPVNGDLWTTTAGVYSRVNGATVGPLNVGDVVGPGTATDNAVARFDSTTGKVVQNSTVTIADSGALTVAAGGIAVTGDSTITGTLTTTGASSFVGDGTFNAQVNIGSTLATVNLKSSLAAADARNFRFRNDSGTFWFEKINDAYTVSTGIISIDVATNATTFLGVAAVTAGSTTNALTVTTTGAIQQSIRYDASNRLDISVTSGGQVQFTPVGTTAADSYFAFNDSADFAGTRTKQFGVSVGGSLTAPASPNVGAMFAATGGLAAGANGAEIGMFDGYLGGVAGGALTTGGFTGVTMYGLNLPDISGGATNYAIRTRAGAVLFGDATTVSAGSTTNALVVTTTGAIQGSFRYDSSNRLDISVGSSGTVTLEAVGSGGGFIFNDNLNINNAAPSLALNVSNTVSATFLSSSTTVTSLKAEQAGGYLNFRTNGSNTDRVRVPASASAGDVWLMVYDETGATMSQVSRGASDSGGTGYRLLRIPN